MLRTGYTSCYTVIEGARMPNPKVKPAQPPQFWNQVPESLWRRLRLEEVFQKALFAAGQPDPYGPLVALLSLESYVEAARRQNRRIKRAMVVPRRPGVKSRSSLFDDTHFYLISWSRIAKLAGFISARTRFHRIGLVLRRYRSDFQSRIDARDHLEHFEERLPGGLKATRLKTPNDLFNMSNQYMTYGGKRLDVGPDSLKLLLTAIREFRTALLYDSIQTIADADGPSLKHLLDRAAKEYHLARITKELSEMLNANVPKS